MKKHIHHIIPKHAGGTDHPSNLIELSIEDHAIAHKELYEKNNKIADKIAWQMLSGRTVSENDRILLAQEGFKLFLSDPKRKSDWIEKIKTARSKQDPEPLIKGFKLFLSDPKSKSDWIEKIKTARSKQVITDETKAKMRESRLKYLQNNPIPSFTDERKETQRQIYFKKNMGVLLAEARKKSETWKNSVTCESHKQKMRETSFKAKKVSYYGVMYSSIRQAALSNNITPSCLRTLILKDADNNIFFC